MDRKGTKEADSIIGMWRVTDIKKWAMQQRNRNWKDELRMIMAGQCPTVWTGANALGHGLEDIVTSNSNSFKNCPNTSYAKLLRLTIRLPGYGAVHCMGIVCCCSMYIKRVSTPT